jgi:hypothetical protein
MSRIAHLWFFIGMLMSGAIVFTIWLTAFMTGQLWSTQWGLLLPILEGLIVVALLRTWIAHRRARQRMHERVSRELRCRWEFPENHRSLRFRPLSRPMRLAM